MAGNPAVGESALWSPAELRHVRGITSAMVNQVTMTASVATAQYQLPVATLTMATARMTKVNTPSTTGRLAMAGAGPGLIRP